MIIITHIYIQFLTPQQSANTGGHVAENPQQMPQYDNILAVCQSSSFTKALLNTRSLQLFNQACMMHALRVCNSSDLV